MMKHKGWTYVVEEDEEPGEVIKLFHAAVHEDGRRVELDLSPYLKEVPEDVFQKLINLNFPTREVISLRSPLRVEDVRNLEMEHKENVK